MSIVLQGSTSGSCTLQEQAIAGTTVLTLPTTSGTILTTGSSGQSIPKAALPTGSVLQVVYGSTSTAVTSTTSSFADTGLSASITPTSSSSKILILVSQNGLQKTNASSSNAMDLTLLRGSTNLLSPNFAGAMTETGTAIGNIISASVCYLDSPATTSSTTYKTQFASRNGTSSVSVQFANISTSTIILMEIAA